MSYEHVTVTSVNSNYRFSGCSSAIYLSGALYAMVYDNTTSVSALLRSTDDGASWSSVWTASVSGVVTELKLNAAGNGLWWLIPASTSVSARYCYTTSLSPVTVTEEDSGVLQPAIAAGTQWVMDGPRTDGSFVLVGMTAARVMGADVAQSSYWTRSSAGVWSAATVTAGDTSNSWQSLDVITYGTKAHQVIRNTTLNQPQWRVLTNSTLGTATGNSQLAYSGTYNRTGVLWSGSTANFCNLGLSSGNAALFEQSFDASTDTKSVGTKITQWTFTIQSMGWAANPDVSGDVVLVGVSGTELRYLERISGSWSSLTVLGSTNTYVSNVVGWTKASGFKSVGFFAWNSTTSTYDWHELKITTGGPTASFSGNGSLTASGGAPPDTPTTAPTVAARTAGGVTVTTPALSASANATSYKIYRDGTLVTSGVAGSTAYADTGASPVSTQTYTVRGVNTVGTSADSPASAAVVGYPNAPAFSAQPGNARVILSFPYPGYSVVYRIYRGTSGGSRSLVHTSTTVTSGTYQWIDTGRTNGTALDYTAFADVSTPTARSSSESVIVTATPAAFSSGATTPARRTAYINDHGDGAIYYAGGSYYSLGPDYNFLDRTTAVSLVPGGSWQSKNAWSPDGPNDGIQLVVGAPYRMVSGSANVYEYNASTDSWGVSATDTLPEAAEYYTGIKVGSDYYVYGNSGAGAHHFWKWTPGTNTWVEKARLYDLGGSYANTTSDVPKYRMMTSGGMIFVVTPFKSIAKYIPVSDQWVEVTSTLHADLMSGTNNGILADPVMVDGAIYFLGSGPSGGDPAVVNRTNVYRYLVSTGTWSIVSTALPNPYWGMNTIVMSGLIYAIGGAQEIDTFSGSNSSETRIYDPGSLNSYLGVLSASGSGTLSLSGQKPIPAVALSGSGSLVGAGTVAVADAVSSTGTGTLGLSGVARFNGTTSLSGAGTLTTIAVVELLPPTNLTAIPISPTQIDLSWTAATSATGYDIERNGAVIVNNQPGTTYSDTGLTQGNAYTYRVRSIKIVAS